ncbi:MAG: flagellar protein FlgN [Epulopiscium sp.]|nr:flagellar protein FlgN [Candidatus Epulonipiscium sp.]
MAGLIYDLIEVLEGEIGFYTILLKISKEKTDIIVSGDVLALQKLTKKEQEAVSQNIRLEKQRETIVGDIALVLNEKKEGLTITKLIEKLENTIEEKEKLKTIQKRINDLIIQLKQVNEQNKVLLNQSMEMINFTMNAIQSTRSFTTNDYGDGGRFQGASGRNFFDTKQ